MDTTTPQGEFLFHVFGALAQFERSLTQERVRAGLAAARRAAVGGAAARLRSTPRRWRPLSRRSKLLSFRASPRLIEVRLFLEPAEATSTRSQHGICSVTQLLAAQRPGRVLLYAAVAA